MNQHKPIRRIGRWRLTREFAWDALARRAGRRRQAKGYAILAAIPADSVGREIFRNGLYEEDLLLAIFDGVLEHYKAAFASSTALDVGANIGNHTLFLSQRFRQVIAFEPNPPAAMICEANVLLNGVANVHVIKRGLSDRDGSERFSVSDMQNLGGGCFGATAGNDTRSILLPLRCGDRELEGLQVNGRIALIKVDVEGHELPVLRGLAATLREHSPFILFESNRTAGANGGAEIVAWLREVGYNHLYSIGRSWALAPNAQGAYGRWVGIVDLCTAYLRGGSYWLHELNALEERAYPLLLATKLPLA